MVTKTQLIITARMIGILSYFSSNDDFYLENTPENFEFVKSMIACSDFPTDTPHIIPDGKRIRVMDTDIMDYCQNILLKTSEEQK